MAVEQVVTSSQQLLLLRKLKTFPDAEFLFIGAMVKWRWKKVPASWIQNHKVEHCWIRQRVNLLKNIGLPFKLISSLIKAKKVIKEFKPDFSGRNWWFCKWTSFIYCSKMGIPTFIQRAEFFCEKTNIFNGKKAKAVFTAYPEMENFSEFKVHF